MRERVRECESMLPVGSAMLLLLWTGSSLLPRTLQQQQQQETPSRCDEQTTLFRFTPCTSCAASPSVLCPKGFSKTTSNRGLRNCSYTVAIGGREVELPGCTHTCQRSSLEPKCCPNHWGALCLPCPSLSGKTCNWHGTCMDGDTGNGTCVCQEGFTGFACQQCSNPNAYGDSCQSECSCVNGKCNNGPEGNGECYCQPPYTGGRCDQVSDSCRNCTAYSHCRGEGDISECQCLPGYRKNALNKCPSVCTSGDCHVHADCSHSGGKLQCKCKAGYQGDGLMCVPVNPCSHDNGGCPLNSTVCVFDGPGKSSCVCMSGMVSADPSSGCSLLSACSPTSCDSTAICETGLDGQHRCECEAGMIGDGRRCYGNLMERVVELDRSGPQKGKLSGTILLFEKGCQLVLTQQGPFTLFLPLLKTPPSGMSEDYVCKSHLVFGQHLYSELETEGDFQTHHGTARCKGNKQFILLDEPSTVYSVIQEDIPAANGIIHIIDKPITKTLVTSPRDEQYADKTIGEILTMDEKYNRFLSLSDNCGAPMPLKGPGPLTVLVPTNQAVDRARDGSLIYMLSDAKHKLQELLKHHMFSQAALTVTELASMTQIQTMANQIIRINLTADGKILLGDKGAALETTNIIASNGIIHMVDGLLFPPSILPILPHRCDVIESKITVGQCVRCSYLYETQCPEGTTELQSHLKDCQYYTPVPSKGCAKYCNSTQQRAECCKGFYGAECKPCIGGFQSPCYGKGTCFDGIQGNGSCACQPAFKGMACHICSDPSKHGDNCDEECRCLHGVCDNRPGSQGACRRGSCLDGFSGDYCDRTATPCNSDGLLEHCHVHAYCSPSGLHTTCVCKAGYEGDGHYCVPVNPCLHSTRGGCDTNADCVYLGPGNWSCVCNEGWSGDGVVCAEIDNCQLETRGGCSPNADCKSLGPAQSECTCKKSYTGNGIVCVPINPCQRNNGGCHALAKCKAGGSGTHTCSCPDGYGGDGVTCYGTVMEELDMNPKIYTFNSWIQREGSVDRLDLSGNITALVPSRSALRNLSLSEKDWMLGRYILPHVLRVHFLPGAYAIENLDQEIGRKLLTLNSVTEWEVRNVSGKIMIGDASIVTPNLPALNGYIHIIDKVLRPPLSDIPPEPPGLIAFLNSTPHYSLFLEATVLYNLTGELESHDFTYTLLVPHDDAIRQYLSQTNATQLGEDVFKSHVILHERLFPDHLRHTVLKNTWLGSSYQIMFHLNNNNQTLANEVPLDGSFTETLGGVLLPIPQVLIVHRNRCSQDVFMQTLGRCTACDGPPSCYSGAKPIRSEFPPNMRSNCKYRKRVGSRRKSVTGCTIKCVKTMQDHQCCPGFFGHDCFKCPGEQGRWCSGRGTCQDGNLGNGECLCHEGFHGTVCEDCEPGRYDINCTQVCRCGAHGKCRDGQTGDGRCVCYKGWKGPSCSVEIVDDACGGVCDVNANCVGVTGGPATCLCVSGFEGNGTSCKEKFLCEQNNGGCSPFANCSKIAVGERSCTCRAGYRGDGVICQEVDGCLVNNGGCDPKAECFKTGPNTVACLCRFGLTGNGRFCFPINPCRTDNGGCHRYGRCLYLGQGKRNCSCFSGHIGDGFDCRGSTLTEIPHLLDGAFFYTMAKGSDPRIHYGRGPFTTFVPLPKTNLDNSVSQLVQWSSLGRATDLTRYHIVSCETLMLADLKSINKAVATSGHTLHFSTVEGVVYINNVSKIVTSDYTTSDGVIHYIDKMLTPYDLTHKPQLNPKMNFTTATQVFGYTRFGQLLQEANLMSLLEDPFLQPFTMFWPSDAALDGLQGARRRWLHSPEHADKLRATVKAHIIRNARLVTVSQPGSYGRYTTMHGSVISCSCDKTTVGDVLLNDNSAKVIDRFMQFDVGVGYGIDQLLEPPGLGAFCDDIQNKTVQGRCGSCVTPPNCPYRSIDTGVTSKCLRRSPYSSGMLPRRHDMSFRYRHMSPWGDLGHYHSMEMMGCQRVCREKAWVPACCPNHYGRDCQVCAGGVEAPCGYHGDCDDGKQGSGTCKCHVGFKGTACEVCQDQHYGPNCTACVCSDRGRCDEGMEGSGSCSCQTGWQGDRCELKLGEIPVCSPECHPEAVCRADRTCECQPPYTGDGLNCTAPDLCGEYNGGCHGNALCSQTGVAINCSCQGGYQGDGFSCEPINRCLEETNGGCSDFATCTFTGPNQRSCECNPGYVGNGTRQCLKVVVPPIDRCLGNNGDCHPKAVCRDLHFHSKTAGVFHLRSPQGKYKMNYTAAQSACQGEGEGATLASFSQMADAQQLGLHLCVAGWLQEQKVGYPTTFPSVKCGDRHVGVVLYKEPVDTSSMYDAYCYREQDVSCVCGSGSVGDGWFCNNDIASVVATTPFLSNFYKELLKYSDSSEEGQSLLDFLSSSSSYSTLFVPTDLGFTLNQTLSGRDLEYHVTSNNSMHFYEDLKESAGVPSRLGLNLSVAVNHSQEQDSETAKRVNTRLLLAWDIPATNGILHVIEAPLHAPPPVSKIPSAPSHTGGATVAVLLLLTGALVAGLGYYVYKHKNDAFRFHYFRNEDEDGTNAPGCKPALVSIPNPLYSGSRAFGQPFAELGPEAEPEGSPEEPPKIIEF